MSSEEMQEQLRLLMEQVQQLTAENTRLKGQPSTNGTVAPSNGTPGDNITPSTSSTSVAAAGQPVPEHYVFVPRERKCPRFSGKFSSDLMSVEDWVEEARRCLSVRRMPLAEQALFLFDHLDAEAKAEMKFHPVTDRDTPDKVFCILLENYACTQVYVSVQQQFYLRTQKDGESVREYSHALKSIMDIAIRKSPEGAIPNSDRTLRDQFIEHLRDDLLRRYLKEKIVTSPTMSFIDARSAALKWVERGKLAGNYQRARAHSCDSYVSTEEVNSNAVAAKPKSEIAEVKEVLRQQQRQLDTILKQLGSSGPGGRERSQWQGDRERSQWQGDRDRSQWQGDRERSQWHSGRGRAPAEPYRFQPDGRPICSRCNQGGHIARFCAIDLNQPYRSSNPTGPRMSSRNQTTGPVSATQPSEN